MKFSRMLAVGAAAALVGVSTLAIGGTASAADFYVTDSEVGFVADGSPYLDSWFSGDVSGPEGTELSTVAGLEISVSPNGYQLLNGNVPTTTGLEALLADAGFTMSAGQAVFQVPAYYADDADADTNLEFTTLRPAAFNTLSGNWVSSSNIMDPTDNSVTLFAANTEYALADMLAAMPSYEILAFGIFAVADATLASITWDGDTHWFLPAPTASITPTSLTIAAMGTTGVSGVFTGFVPGETVRGFIHDGGSGGPFPGAFTADVNGSVTVTFSAANMTAGTYFLGAEGLTSGVIFDGAFAVTANPAQLAATGADFTPAIVAGGVFLLLGAGFVVAGRRRRAAAHRN